MITINEYLDEIFREFKVYATSGVKLCQLKNVHFDGGRLPDYSDIHIQQLYLLRYAYAYGFEYKWMYQSLLRRIENSNALRVTSIGCGSMIDYWALTQVVPEQCTIRYTGIDTIDWSYRMESRPQDDVCFINENVISLFDTADELTSDIYIFPKSISEFSVRDIRTLSRCFSKKLPKNKTVYFLFTLRYDERNLDTDMSKTKILFDAMVENGYKTSDESNEYRILSSDLKDKKIREVDGTFLHPSEVYDFLRNELHRVCAKYIKNGVHCREDCKARLSWAPILNCRQVQWQMYAFRKEEDL